MAETLTRASPTPPESVSEVPPEPDPEEEFFEVFSTPSPPAFFDPKQKKEYFQNKLKEYRKDEPLIEHLKGPEQPALPLIVKSKCGNVEALQVLLESELFGTTETRDCHGRTALSHAAELQNHCFMELLLLKGANTDAKDNDGRTPLSWAAATGHQYNWFSETTSSILMLHGAEINSEDNEKRTPLIWAIMQSSAIMIDELLDRERIMVNCQDKNWQTPLILAAKKEDYDLMKLLIKKKKSRHLPTRRGSLYIFLSASRSSAKVTQRWQMRI